MVYRAMIDTPLEKEADTEVAQPSPAGHHSLVRDRQHRERCLDLASGAETAFSGSNSVSTLTFPSTPGDLFPGEAQSSALRRTRLHGSTRRSPVPQDSGGHRCAADE